jgi:hypothetical protein
MYGLLGRNYMSAELRLRNAAGVEREWNTPATPSYRQVSEVLDILAEQCNWPCSLFIPQDAMRVILWSYDYDLAPVDAVLLLSQSGRISKAFDDVYARAINQTCGEFMASEVLGKEPKFPKDMHHP